MIGFRCSRTLFYYFFTLLVLCLKVNSLGYLRRTLRQPSQNDLNLLHSQFTLLADSLPRIKNQENNRYKRLSSPSSSFPSSSSFHHQQKIRQTARAARFLRKRISRLKQSSGRLRCPVRDPWCIQHYRRKMKLLY